MRFKLLPCVRDIRRRNEPAILHAGVCGHGSYYPSLIQLSRPVRSAIFAFLGFRLLTQAIYTVIGALVVMMGITIANMRKGVLLHKLILLEVCASYASFPVVP